MSLWSAFVWDVDSRLPSVGLWRGFGRELRLCFDPASGLWLCLAPASIRSSALLQSVFILHRGGLGTKVKLTGSNWKESQTGTTTYAPVTGGFEKVESPVPYTVFLVARVGVDPVREEVELIDPIDLVPPPAVRDRYPPAAATKASPTDSP